MSQTKIETIKAREILDSLSQLADAGMNIARLNFSHGSHEWHGERIRLIWAIETERGQPIAILQDLCDPKLRIGQLSPEGVYSGPGKSDS